MFLKHENVSYRSTTDRTCRVVEGRTREESGEGALAPAVEKKAERRGTKCECGMHTPS